MNRQIGKLGGALLFCYLLLFVQLNNLTIFGAQRLKDNPENNREIIRDFDAPRGLIATADGIVMAQTLDNPQGSTFDRQRVYPEGDLYAHLTGYFSLALGSTGLEASYHGDLAGRGLEFTFTEISDLFVDRERVGDLNTTVIHSVQLAAKNALGLKRGSVVALDPRTGAILAMYSNPSYDPNALANQDFAVARDARAALLAPANPDRPLLEKSFRERYAPGSTFKVVTAASGLEDGRVTATSPVYPVSSEFLPPQTSLPIRNFGGSTCGGDVFEALRVSCNTAFAQMALELGPKTMIEAAEDFGFNATPPIDLPNPARSVFPTDFKENLPALAQSGIGQNDVAATPLQMALVAAAIANEGVIMRPFVVGTITDDQGKVVRTNAPAQWRRAVSGTTAQILRDAMRNVADAGTATNLRVSGFEVGGKTGSAQTGRDTTHAWIIGFAGPPGQAPTVVVSVIVEGNDANPNQTGGSTAAPIGQAVLAAALTATG